MAYQSRHTGQEIDDGIDNIPTKTSDLINDNNFIVSKSVKNIQLVTEYPAIEEIGVLYILMSVQASV